MVKSGGIVKNKGVYDMLCSLFNYIHVCLPRQQFIIICTPADTVYIYIVLEEE